MCLRQGIHEAADHRCAVLDSRELGASGACDVHGTERTIRQNEAVRVASGVFIEAAISPLSLMPNALVAVASGKSICVQIPLMLTKPCSTLAASKYSPTIVAGIVDADDLRDGSAREIHWVDGAAIFAKAADHARQILEHAHDHTGAINSGCEARGRAWHRQKSDRCR